MTKYYDIFRTVNRRWQERAGSTEAINIRSLGDVIYNLGTILEEMIWDDKFRYNEEAALKCAIEILKTLEVE